MASGRSGGCEEWSAGRLGMMGAWSLADQDIGPSTSQLLLDPHWHSLRALVIGTAELQKGGSDAGGGGAEEGRCPWF